MRADLAEHQPDAPLAEPRLLLVHRPRSFDIEKVADEDDRQRQRQREKINGRKILTEDDRCQRDRDKKGKDGDAPAAEGLPIVYDQKNQKRQDVIAGDLSQPVQRSGPVTRAVQLSHQMREAGHAPADDTQRRRRDHRYGKPGRDGRVLPNQIRDIKDHQNQQDIVADIGDTFYEMKEHSEIRGNPGSEVISVDHRIRESVGKQINNAHKDNPNKTDALFSLILLRPHASKKQHRHHKCRIYV